MARAPRATPEAAGEESSSTVVVNVVNRGTYLNGAPRAVADSVEITQEDLVAIQALQEADGVERVKVATVDTLD